MQRDLYRLKYVITNSLRATSVEIWLPLGACLKFETRVEVAVPTTHSGEQQEHRWGNERGLSRKPFHAEGTERRTEIMCHATTHIKNITVGQR